MGWLIGKLKRNLTSTKKDAAAHLVWSVNRYLSILDHHTVSGSDALRTVAAVTDPDEALKRAFGLSDYQVEHNQNLVIGQANMIAAALAVRSTAEVFAQLVNMVVLSNALATDKCSFRSVYNLVSFAPLRDEMRNTIDSAAFCYVSDFVNVSKHQLLVSQTFQLRALDRDPEVVVRVSEFDYSYKKGGALVTNRHPAREGMDLLRDVIEVRNRLIDCGAALNAALGV